MNDVPVVPLATASFSYRLPFGKEINRKRWVDREVNNPEERRPRRSTCNRVF